MVKEGDRAAEFKLPATGGGEVGPQDFRGKRVVLYFYPKDDTSGYTREATDFRDNMDRLTAAGAVVLGVSRDSVASHESFRARHGLPFPLVSDPDSLAAGAYGVHEERTSRGKTTNATVRSTFLIDEEGRIARAWRDVEVEGHVEEVLAAVGAPVMGNRGNRVSPHKRPARRP